MTTFFGRSSSPSFFFQNQAMRLASQWGLEGGDEVTGLGKKIGGGRVLLDEADDGRADDDAVGQAAHLAGVLRGADAEAHTHRLGGDGTQRPELLGQLRGEGGALAG